MPRRTNNNNNEAARALMASHNRRNAAADEPWPYEGQVLALDGAGQRRRQRIVDERANTWEAMKAIVEKVEAAGGVATDRDIADYAAAERRVDELDDEYDTMYRTTPRLDTAAVLAAWGSGASSQSTYVEDRPLAAGQTMRGAVRAFGWDRDSRDLSAMRDESGRDLDLQAVLRNALNNGSIRNAMGGDTDGAGGYMIPTVLSADLIDKARAATRVLQAGARVVPMSARVVDVPVWASDANAEWRKENDPLAEDDAGLGVVTLTAKTMAVVVKASRESIEDSDLASALEASFVNQTALAFDKAALYGPASGDGPVGLKDLAEVAKTPLATDGATPTWDDLVDAVGRLRDANEDPTAQITSDRTLRTLAKIKTTGGEYVAPPTYLDEVVRYSTGQVPTDLTVGTSTDTSDVFTADWSQLLMGVRTDVTITRLVERYAPDGQIGFVLWFRGDVQPARASAFDVVTGVRP